MELVDHLLSLGPRLAGALGLGVVAAASAIATVALRRPRPSLATAAWLCLVGALAACGWVIADAKLAIVDQVFVADGAELRRGLTMAAIRPIVAVEFERFLNALWVAAVVGVVATPLATAAGLRVWAARPRRRAAVALVGVAVIAPLVAAAAALARYADLLSPEFQHHAGSFDVVSRAAIYAELFAGAAPLRLALIGVGVVAAIVGMIAATRAAGVGRTIRFRGSLAALAVFLVGGGLFLNTRDHAADLRDGPESAFAGGESAYGALLRDAEHPDFITPPTAEGCALGVDTAQRISLVINAAGLPVFDGVAATSREAGLERWTTAVDALWARREALAEAVGRPQAPELLEVFADRDAPTPAVRELLRVAAQADIEEVIVASRRPLTETTRTLGAIRVDKLCALGRLHLQGADGAALRLDRYATWGELAAVVADARAPLGARLD
jgi:hypothetical protein